MKKIDRLQFLQLAGGIVGAGIAAAAAACGGDDTSAPGGPACDSNPPAATIAQNHAKPHVLTIPAADAKASQMKSYVTTGADHVHTVDVTATDFQTLESGATLFLTSSVFTDGHSHSITIKCG
jgi:hypothetical protein